MNLILDFDLPAILPVCTQFGNIVRVIDGKTHLDVTGVDARNLLGEIEKERRAVADQISGIVGEIKKRGPAPAVAPADPDPLVQKQAGLQDKGRNLRKAADGIRKNLPPPASA